MRGIFNANRSGSMPDQRPTGPRREVTDVRSGSMPNATPDRPTAEVVDPVRHRIVLRNGQLVVVEVGNPR